MTEKVIPQSEQTFQIEFSFADFRKKRLFRDEDDELGQVTTIGLK